MSTTHPPTDRDPHANIVFVVPDRDGSAEAQGCLALMTVFTIVCWVIFFVGLLAFVGILKF